MGTLLAWDKLGPGTLGNLHWVLKAVARRQGVSGAAGPPKLGRPRKTKGTLGISSWDKLEDLSAHT